MYHTSKVWPVPISHLSLLSRKIYYWTSEKNLVHLQSSQDAYLISAIMSPPLTLIKFVHLGSRWSTAMFFVSAMSIWPTLCMIWVMSTVDHLHRCMLTIIEKQIFGVGMRDQTTWAGCHSDKDVDDDGGEGRCGGPLSQAFAHTLLLVALKN